MKKLFPFLILLITLSSANAHPFVSSPDSVTYEILKQKSTFFIEIPFGVGVASSAACYPSLYGDYRDANLYFGINAKYYMPNEMRIDLGYKASFIGSDDFEYMEYNTEFLLRANYPLLSGHHRWGELVFVNSSQYFFANTPKYRYLNAHGGYFRFQGENKLLVGLNYSTNSLIKVDLPKLGRKKSAYSYFEVGGEVLLRMANSQFAKDYYTYYNQNIHKVGWNTYIIYNYNYMMGKLEIGGHNGPILKFTIGITIPG